jgi:Voltage gated chloride channel
MPVFAGINGENSQASSATGAENGMIESESSTTGVSLLNGVQSVHVSVHQQSSLEVNDAEFIVGLSDSAVNGNSKVLVNDNAHVASNDEIPSSPLISLVHLEDIKIVDALKLQYAIYDLTFAIVVGVLTGVFVAVFKLSIDAVRLGSYSLDILDYFHEGAVFIPALGGFIVGSILLFGKLPPGLRGQVNEVDELSRGPIPSLQMRIQAQLQSLRKSAAAVFTLGTGNSLGPEGPCVELGMGIARSCMDITTEHAAVKRREFNRVLLSCGASAGVAAGFDAPLAGVFCESMCYHTNVWFWHRNKRFLTPCLWLRPHNRL